MAAANIETRKDKCHSIKCFQELHSLWQSEQLCDLTLKVGKTEFKVHKMVLVSCSPYFKNMFTTELCVESNKNFVELFQVDIDAFKIVLDYFYTGQISLTQETAERILRTADFFALKTVKAMCCEYLSKNIGVSNCIRRYIIGVTFDFEILKSQAQYYIMQQIDVVSKMPEFRAMNEDILKELLGSNKDDGKAEQLYNATMEWVMHDLNNRKSLLPDLLVLIPTEGISYEFYFENMKNDKILRQDFRCTNWLLDNFLEKFAKDKVAASCRETNIFITSRVKYNRICYQFKIESNELVKLPPRPNIILFSAVHYKNWIYLVTGKLHMDNIESSLKYNISKSKWSEIDLSFERGNAGACILHDKLYVIGGYDWANKSLLESCICYDFDSERQYTIADMDEKRYLPGVGIYENSVYVCCGDVNNTKLSSIKRFDPREGLWCNVGNYQTAKGACSSAVISSAFYTSILGKEIVERFDFRNNASEGLAKPAGHNGCWITSANKKLFRVCKTGLSEYDANNNQWLEKECEFNLWEPIIVSWDST